MGVQCLLCDSAYERCTLTLTLTRPLAGLGITHNFASAWLPSPACGSRLRERGVWPVCRGRECSLRMQAQKKASLSPDSSLFYYPTIKPSHDSTPHRLNPGILLHIRRMLIQPLASQGLVHPVHRSRITPPLLRRPNRPPHQLPTAIRTNILQHALRAIRTKRAFESTDHRRRRLRRQIPVTAFAVRSQCKHCL
jgi:hypothetical protein